MSNTWFQFKHFRINQDKTAMKVGVDSVLLASAANFNKPRNILDIGAGTGILSFAAAQRTDAPITAIEIEKNAFEQCRENAELNKLQNRVNVLHISFQEFLKKNYLKFDHIISNPPYFEKSLKPENTARALAGHSESLPFEVLAKGVSEIMTEEGVFSLILPFDKASKFEQICNKYGMICRYKLTVYPKINKNPNRMILEFSFKKQTLKTEKIIIRESDTNLYTNSYKELTKDFYLNF
ncbi:MAG: methyltransferase [Chlorobi bacterium]|nr:methyltransferase [Chlorobiota bacterium]